MLVARLVVAENEIDRRLVVCTRITGYCLIAGGRINVGKAAGGEVRGTMFRYRNGVS
jgi:hypothetical protein